MTTSDPRAAQTESRVNEPPSDQEKTDLEPAFVLTETLTLERMFTSREADLVQRLLAFAHDDTSGCGPDVLRAIEEGGRRLAALVLAMESYPSLLDVTTLGAKERSRDSLMRTLEASGGHAVEWSLPTKAVIARTFGIAKVNFWVSLSYVVQTSESPERAALMAGIEEAIEEAVFTRLAEELYGSFAASTTTDIEVKRAAIDHVIDLWEGRVRFATYQFCPILRSAWAARMRAPRTFGTLGGTAELMQLLFEDCDQRFVEVLSTESTGEEVVGAFEEFLFDLPYESIQKVRRKMAEEDKSVVGPDEVAAYLGLGELRPKLAGAKALYSSFRGRRVKAQYRTSMHLPGPHRTAESYVLEALLRAEARENGTLEDDEG
jgi:hypothetical protein